MSRVKAILVILFTAAVAILFVVQQRRLDQIRSTNRELQAQLKFLAGQDRTFSSESHQGVSSEQFLELMRLRGEIGVLRLQSTRANAAGETSERAENQAKWAEWVATVRANGVRLSDAPYLIAALRNEDPSIRLEAIKTVRLIGLETIVNTNMAPEIESEWRNASQLAVPDLVELLDDADGMLRANAAITLGFLGERSEFVVPTLARLLEDEESRVAQSAAKALGRFHEEARSAVPDLVRAASGTDEGLQKAAEAALQQIESTDR